MFAAKSESIYFMTNWRVGLKQGQTQLVWTPGSVAIPLLEAEIPPANLPARENLFPHSVNQVRDGGTQDLFTVFVTVMDTSG